MRTPDTIFFLTKICISYYYFCNACPRRNQTRAGASRRTADKFYHTVAFVYPELSIVAGRARDAPFARTVTLICNTCGSSKLPMRKDEWCVRMRLRPDCGGISQVERERDREKGAYSRDRVPPRNDSLSIVGAVSRGI